MKQMNNNNTLNEQLSKEHERERENSKCTLGKSLQTKQKSSPPEHCLYQYKTFVLFQHERQSPI